jgi:signal transduction histidine kinase/ActR/RegA family two-component response regulator
MTDIRRSLFVLALAALVPVLVFAAVLVAVLSLREQAAIEANALAEDRQIASGIDQFMAAQLKAAEIMAQAASLQIGDLRAFYGYARILKAREPLWSTVVLADTEGHQVLNVVEPFGSPPEPIVEAESYNAVITSRRPVIGNVYAGGDAVATIFVPVRAPVLVNGELKYVLSLWLDPRAMEVLFRRANAPADWIGAVVDRNGRVVARSVRGSEFVGGLANAASLAALKHGPEGLYEGRTLEDLDMVSAFYTSPLTGWSVHYALPRAVYNAPLRLTLWIAIVSGIGVVALAVLLASLIGREIAHRRRIEAATAQSQKLEALGQFTGGIAHDFNNMLTAVLGNLELARRRLADHPMLKHIDRAYDAAQRGAKLTGQLLAFARKQHMTPRAADVNPVIEATQELIRTTLGGTIEMRMRLRRELWPALIDPTQIEMALVNLALNARDAMPNGGTLSIETANLPAADARLPQGHDAADHVMIEVRDTGSGMSEAVRSRVMEPFFTTKPPGQGTGLGLSQVHGVVTQLGGALTIDSALGAGTTARMLLPRVARADAAVQTDAAPVQPRPQAMRILLVDDDAEVRVATAELLQSLGCQVEEAADGETALRAVNGGSHFDAMLTDFAMPTMVGTELARRVRASHPDLPIIMVTGYVEAIADMSSITLMLKKPFSSAELTAALRQCGGQGLQTTPAAGFAAPDILQADKQQANKI